jgi:peptide-methionine (S)-S-oxide reductase
MALNHLKSIALAIAIFLGFIVQGHMANAAKTETAILAGGCFLCVESDFESVPGVLNVVSGYTGGTAANPTYKQGPKGGTGH